MAAHLKGNRVFYDSDAFPYRKGVPINGIIDQLHYVIDTSLLGPEFRTLGDYRRNIPVPMITVVALTLIADAVKHTLRLRGAHAGAESVGKDPRIVVMLHYITREVFSNTEARILLSEESTFEHNNVVALMFSVLVMDEDLSLSDAVGDMLEFNRRGLPWSKKRDGVAIAAGGELPRGAAAPGRNRNRAIPRLLEEDEVVMDDAGPGDGDPAAPAAGGANFVIGRPDVPGHSLSDNRSTYFFPAVNVEHARQLLLRDETHKHMHINSLSRYIDMVQTVANYYADIDLNEKRSSQHLSQLALDHPYRPEVLFTLENALDRLQALGAHELFCDPSAWINTHRPGPYAGQTFGAPAWPAGQLVFDPDSDFLHRVPQYAAGCMRTTASVPLEYFTASALIENCLPHCRIIDAHLLKPDDSGIGRFIRNTHLVPRPGQGDGAVAPMPISICLDDLFEAMGLPTAVIEHERSVDSAIKRDIFNAYFERYAPLAAKINESIGSLAQPSGTYIERLAQLREQGFRVFNSVMDPSNAELPRSYRALIYASWKRTAWTPLCLDMWQKAEVAMTPFAQQRARQLLAFETIVKTSDTMIFLLGQLLRAAYTIYLPRNGKHQNKEHMQLVCGPGTSKSDMLNKLCDSLFIKDTYEVQGGASAMGAIGEAASERMLEVFHEMSQRYAPKTDPKNEDDQMHKMLLTMLSEGEKAYKTTARQTNASGQDSYTTGKIDTIRSEYTSVIVGARNHSHFTGDPNGAGEAMHDRFTTVAVMPLVCAHRVSIINQVLQAGPTVVSTANIRLREQYALRQRVIMEYGALICYYAVPLPDLSLFSDLAPLAVAYLTITQPELDFKLRIIKGLLTRMSQEVITDSIDKALFSALNPSARVVQRQDGSHYVRLDDYDTRICAVEASRYAYARMETLVFVLTEKMYELTGGSSAAIMREFAERRANYWSIGRSPEERRADYRPNYWPPEADAANWYAVQRQELAASQKTVSQFVSSLLAGSPVYYLSVPASHSQQQHRRAPGLNATDVLYNSFELIPEKIDSAYDELFEINATVEHDAERLRRLVRPAYKVEKRDSESFYNPNYLTFNGSIRSFAASISGRIGNYNLSETAIADLLYSLSRQTMITPYFPLVKENTQAVTTDLPLIQSLRYVKNGMRRFPKYRVPVVINDLVQNRVSVLISYLERDLYRLAQGMLDHISYHSTRPCKTLTGLPSSTGGLFYEAISIGPIRNKKLRIPGKNNVRTATSDILAAYFYEDEPAAVVPGADGSPMTEQLRREGRTYLTEDIEEVHAMNYLVRNFPSESREQLRRYLPRGIEQRLYGAADGFYTTKLTERLTGKPYVEAMMDKMANDAGAAAVAADSLQPGSVENSQTPEESNISNYNNDDDVNPFEMVYEPEVNALASRNMPARRFGSLFTLRPETSMVQSDSAAAAASTSKRQRVPQSLPNHDSRSFLNTHYGAASFGSGYSRTHLENSNSNNNSMDF